MRRPHELLNITTRPNQSRRRNHAIKSHHAVYPPNSYRRPPRSIPSSHIYRRRRLLDLQNWAPPVFSTPLLTSAPAPALLQLPAPAPAPATAPAPAPAPPSERRLLLGAFPLPCASSPQTFTTIACSFHCHGHGHCHCHCCCHCHCHCHLLPPASSCLVLPRRPTKLIARFRFHHRPSPPQKVSRLRFTCTCTCTCDRRDNGRGGLAFYLGLLRKPLIPVCLLASTGYNGRRNYQVRRRR